MSTSSPKHNLAARMAVWSSRHRKKAFWGWLAFVVVVFAAGNMVGTKSISDVDQFSGESHRAEATLDGAGLRPVKEVVFLQSDKLTVKDPEFRAAVQDAADSISKVAYVKNVKSPLTGAGAVSADGHAALVDFQIAGDSTEAMKRVDPVLAAVAAVHARHPALDIRQLGGASAKKSPCR
jgi:putative drug exporter of the RND superfamily